MTDFDQCYDTYMQELQSILPNVFPELTHDIIMMTADNLKIVSDRDIISITGEASPVVRS